MELLKYGLSHSIPPKLSRKTEVFSMFDMIQRFFRSDLSSNQFESALKTDISYLGNNYYNNYRPSLNALKKHKILEKLRRNLIIFSSVFIAGFVLVITCLRGKFGINLPSSKFQKTNEVNFPKISQTNM